VLKRDAAAPPTLTEYRRTVRRPAEVGAGSAMPLVSLITVTREARVTLPRTIASVQRQSFASIEHVVVDGASTDGTAALLSASLRPRDCWISEPDRGISDALNKGVALARGRYVQFVHADDWLSDDQVERAVETLELSGADFVFGDLVFYEGDRAVFEYAGDPHYRRRLARRLPALNHPTVLARATCFERIGLFDLRYRCAMEYDWFMRLHRAGGHGVHSPRIRGHMNHDGISNVDYHRTIREVRAIAIAYGRHPCLAYLEAGLQHTKMTAGRWTKAYAAGLYHRVRRRINPSFRPLA
jgi:glycosyltransferase involved in cell wall biosynthesis